MVSYQQVTFYFTVDVIVWYSYQQVTFYFTVEVILWLVINRWHSISLNFGMVCLLLVLGFARKFTLSILFLFETIVYKRLTTWLLLSISVLPSNRHWYNLQARTMKHTQTKMIIPFLKLTSHQYPTLHRIFPFARCSHSTVAWPKCLC